ncbi:hypothetical protein [Metabacillus sp. RGM 3146]|uniref:hypothetical protein n=1 Tax=Metabacillus sp. RGM 3146 TaxID=3401092 RepID=UPI003B9CB1B3
MSLLNAKVLETQYGLETYIDENGKIEAMELHIPSKSSYDYELKIGVEYFLLRDKHYTVEKNFFWIRMDADFRSVMLGETEMESLFAVKSEAEREETKALIGEWLIRTNAFKQAITELIEKQKTENVTTEEEIRVIIENNKFLEKLLLLKAEDIENAIIENDEINLKPVF